MRAKSIAVATLAVGSGLALGIAIHNSGATGWLLAPLLLLALVVGTAQQTLP